MHEVECPDCSAILQLDDEASEGDELVCYRCGAKLIITYLDEYEARVEKLEEELEESYSIYEDELE